MKINEQNGYRAGTKSKASIDKLTTDKVNFMEKIIRNKEGYLIMININSKRKYNSPQFLYTKQHSLKIYKGKVTELKGEIDKHRIIAEDFNTSLGDCYKQTKKSVRM